MRSTILIGYLGVALASFVGIRTAGATRICYVAPSGGVDDSLHGSSTGAPLATIQYALDSATPQCTTIKLMAGTFAEHVKVTRDATSDPLVIESDKPATPAVIAPNTIDTTTPRQAAVGFYDAAYVTLRNVVITNNIDAYCTAVPVSSSYCNSAGIDIRNLVTAGGVGSGASSHHITIEHNEIRDVNRPSLKTDDTNTICSSGVDCKRRYDALPIAIYSDRDGLDGTGARDDSEATHHIQIIDNDIHDCDGSSDVNTLSALVIYQNVEHVLVKDNQFDDLMSTSIYEGAGGAIGLGGTWATGSASDPFQRARHVVVRDNQITDTPMGVFIQGATDVLVERNLIEDNLRGVQIVTEGPTARDHAYGRASRIWIRDNRVVDAARFGIDVGALSIACNGYSQVEDVYVTNNTVLMTPPTSGVMTFGIIARTGIGGDSVFVNNLIELTRPSPSNYDFLFRRDEATTITGCPGGSVTLPFTVTFDYDLWYTTTGAYQPFISYALPSYSPTFESFATYQGWGDANGSFTAPQLTTGAQPVNASSPAVDTGTLARSPSSWTPDFGYYDTTGETDCIGNPRVVGHHGATQIDRGACELQ